MNTLPLSLMAGAAMLALLTGCARMPVGPDYAAPEPLSPTQTASAGPFQSSPGVAAEMPLPPGWWQLYQNPQLNALVDDAFARPCCTNEFPFFVGWVRERFLLRNERKNNSSRPPLMTENCFMQQRPFAHNTDLRQAMANLERSQALEAEVHGAERPTVAVNGGPGFGHVSGLSVLQKDDAPPSRFTYSAGVSLSYQFDVLGQLRRAIEAAEADTGAAEAALDLVRVNVAAGTARAYAQVCSSGLRLRSARTSVQLQEEAVQLADRLRQAGKVGDIDGARARGQLEQLRAALPPLLAQRQAALYQLATLTGKAPRDFPKAVADCEEPPRLTGLLPVGDGAALLRRRPDVRQAERRLASATARIGVATADLYPKVSLGLSAASAGFATRFGNRETFSYNLGPLISWTVPNTGVARARIAQADAATRAAAAQFDGTVLTALREVETALDAYAQALDRHATLTAARDHSATVAQQARMLYVHGKTAQLDALDAERTLAASEAALAASLAQLAEDQCAVFLALGGGWESPAGAATAAP